MKEGRHRWALCQSQRQHWDLSPDTAGDDALVLDMREEAKNHYNERILEELQHAFLHLSMRHQGTFSTTAAEANSTSVRASLSTSCS